MTAPPKKPDFTLPPVTGTNDLLSRLNSFLPQLSEANRTLEEEIKQGKADKRNIEHVDETTERFIEMNLGLGVLEEIRDGDSSDEEMDTASTDASDPISAALNQMKSGKKPIIQLMEDEPMTGMKRPAPPSDSEDSDDSEEDSEEEDSEEDDSEEDSEDEKEGEKKGPVLEKLGGDLPGKKVLIEEL
ncbi:hypothetical protein FPQ18DRAFT_355441 [Pyronema domesticum]|uniref:Similar to Uncharacterized protein C12orf45 homolog acc. no. Q9CX66 n=1 Tax=Pyronema omphalodes (strain CBS 100304) TaxID=1076935 RepID=U4LIA6_PYROM|nr:hypothetical protein FPQ18DRAFT_355441 [Pyronema domesticum]CCX12064.1 Similar to Uncharacterized protein C12orf45 homolog; acc. no. Q9CX66 [Pyronema omphalodes CBS 100304]